MDFENISISLFLIFLGVAIFLFIIASYRIFDTKSYWASRLTLIGSSFSLLAWILFSIFTIDQMRGNYALSDETAFLITIGLSALLGVTFSILGLVGLCARFRGSSKRQLELQQMISILEAESNR